MFNNTTLLPFNCFEDVKSHTTYTRATTLRIMELVSTHRTLRRDVCTQCFGQKIWRRLLWKAPRSL